MAVSQETTQARSSPEPIGKQPSQSKPRAERYASRLADSSDQNKRWPDTPAALYIGSARL